MIDFDVVKLHEAIRLILAGTCNRVDISDTVKVYKCKNVIRVDIKIDG